MAKANRSGQVQLIFLVGMPAVGKTYWGNKIAAEYKVPFVDLDVFIAQQEKASISALFAMYGENGFREREQTYLGKIIKSATTTTIIGCGGGTPCFNDNLELMKRSGTVVYLQADISWILNNLKNSKEIRPLLNNRPLFARCRPMVAFGKPGRGNVRRRVFTRRPRLSVTG